MVTVCAVLKDAAGQAACFFITLLQAKDMSHATVMSPGPS